MKKVASVSSAFDWILPKRIPACVQPMTAIMKTGIATENESQCASKSVCSMVSAAQNNMENAEDVFFHLSANPAKSILLTAKYAPIRK